MTKDCIKDFIRAWKEWDRAEPKDSQFKVWNESVIQPFWNTRFQDAGYYSAEPSRESIRGYWQEMHRWCEEQFSPDHYAWTGSTFWFETERNALLFSLKWA